MMYKVVSMSYYQANGENFLSDYPMARQSADNVEVVISTPDGNLTKSEALAHINANWLNEPPTPTD